MDERDAAPRLNAGLAAALFAALLVSDVAMMVLHTAYAWTVEGKPTFLVLRDPGFSLNRDGGFAEWIEYGKSAVAAAAMYVCARRFGSRLFLALAGVHLWLLADNALRFHERIGYVAGLVFAPSGAAGMASRDIGQPIGFAFVASGILVLLWLAWRGASGPQRRLAMLLVPAAGSIAFFGVFIDGLHASPLGPRFGDVFWTLLEDGGETLVLSLNCALAAGFAVQPQPQPAASRAAA